MKTNSDIMCSVIFGNDHKNPLGALQSLGQAGVRSIAVCWGEQTGTLESSNFLKRVFFGKTAEECIDILLNIIPEGKKGVITPCCDEAAIVIDKNRERLKHKYFFEYSNRFSFEELSDKGVQTKLAKEAGMHTPAYFVLRSIEDIPDNTPFPCIIKPLVAMKGSKADLRVCNDKTELIKNMKEVLPHNDGLILQQYIDKEHEILIECCRTSKGITIAPGIIKNELNRLYPPQVGLSGLHEVIPLEEGELKNQITKLLDLMEYVGLISIEFAKSASTGQYFFFEFNIRNDGYNPCITKMGANINYYYVCDMLGIPFEVNTIKHGFVISEIRHLQLLFHRMISFSDWLNDIRKSDGFTWKYNDDKKPFYKMIFHSAIDSIKARTKRFFSHIV